MPTCSHRLRSCAAAALLGAAVAAPTAHAARPDDRAGIREPGVSAVSSSTSVIARHRALGRLQELGDRESSTLRPDDRAGIRGAAPSSTFSVQTVSAGFHWGDAAIGGAFGLALALLATGAVFVSLRRRSSPRPA